MTLPRKTLARHVSNNQRIEEIYPKHIQALREAKLITNRDIPEIPTMKDLWIKNEKEREKVKLTHV